MPRYGSKNIKATCQTLKKKTSWKKQNAPSFSVSDHQEDFSNGNEKRPFLFVLCVHETEAHP
ncbi:hypothetical protein CCP4SC76_3980005 [Gammaproteobacteria bacterium]